MVDVRSSVERFRRAWLKAREGNRDLGYLTMTRDAVDELSRRLHAHGVERVESVVLYSLAQAQRGEISPSWWSRIFVGNGYAARSASYDAHLEREEIMRKNPISAFEIALLKTFDDVDVVEVKS